MKKLRRLAVAGIGAAAMYLADPDRGRSRRTQLKDRLGSVARGSRRQAGQQKRHQANLAEGARHAGRPPAAVADDRMLRDRVSSELGAAFPHDRLVLDVVDRVVEVRGEVRDPAEMDTVVEALGRVPGVAGVHNLTHLPGAPAPTKAEALRATATAESHAAGPTTAESHAAGPTTAESKAAGPTTAGEAG